MLVLGNMGRVNHDNMDATLGQHPWISGAYPSQAQELRWLRWTLIQCTAIVHVPNFTFSLPFWFVSFCIVLNKNINLSKTIWTRKGDDTCWPCKDCRSTIQLWTTWEKILVKKIYSFEQYQFYRFLKQNL